MKDSWEQAGDHPEKREGLYAQDAEALDALIDAGWNLEKVPPPVRERAARAASLLGVLQMSDEAHGAFEPALVDVTLARVMRSDKAAAPAPAGPTLLRDDAEALDRLVESGWQIADLPGRLTKNARRIEKLLGTLQPARKGRGSADLVERTIHAVMQERRAFDASPLDLRMSRRPGFRLADIGAIAAMLFVSLAVLWPTLGATRQQAIRQSCAAGLANAGVGFSMYANDHNGRMPAVDGSIPVSLPGSTTWWNVGSASRSHSANLFVLVKTGYAELSDLNCEANPNAPHNLDVHKHNDWRASEEVSYSYQLFTSRDRLTGDRDALLLVDRSPVVVRAMRNESSDAQARSLNHGAIGQNALFADRAVIWLTKPMTPRGQDNIWLPESLSGRASVTLTGSETPDGPKDAFVGP